MTFRLFQEKMNFESGDLQEAPTRTKPDVKPGTKPGTRPGAPRPVRRKRPQVEPRPKAELEEVLQKLNDLTDTK